MDNIGPLDGLRGVSPFIYTGGARIQLRPEAGTLESQVHDVRMLGASQAAARFDQMEVAELLSLGFELEGTARTLGHDLQACAAALERGVEPEIHDFEQARSTMLQFQHKHVLALCALADATVASKTEGGSGARLAEATRFLELRVAQKDIAESLHEEQALILAQTQRSGVVLGQGGDQASVFDDEIYEAITERLMGCWGALGANVQIAEQQALCRLRDRIDECLQVQQLGFDGHLQSGPDGKASLFESFHPERVKIALDLVQVRQVIEAGLGCHEKSVPDLVASRVRGQVWAAIGIDEGPDALRRRSALRDVVLDNFVLFNEAVGLQQDQGFEGSAADRAALSSLDEGIGVMMFEGINPYLAGLDDLLGLKKHVSHDPATLFYSGDMALSTKLEVVFDGVSRLQDFDPTELSSPVADIRRRLGEAVEEMSRRLRDPGARPDTFGCRFADSVSNFETYGGRTPDERQYREMASLLLTQESDPLVPLPDWHAE